MSVADLSLRLLGLDDPIEIFSLSLEWLGGGVAASLGSDQTVVLARPGQPPRPTRVRGRVDAAKVERLLEVDPVSRAELTDGGRAIGYLAIPGRDRSLLDVVAPVTGRALAIAQALREARSDLRIAQVATASMQTLIEGSTLARAFFDESSRVTTANEAFAAVVSTPVRDCIGSTLRELGVPESESLEAVLRSVLRGDKASASLEVASEGPLLQRRVWIANVIPIRIEGRCVGGALVLDERTHAAREDARARLVGEAYACLRGDGAETVLPALLVPALADWAVLDIVERGVVRHVGAAHRDPKLRDKILELPTDRDRRGRPRGVALVLETLRPDLVETDDVTLLLASDPELASVVRALGEGPQLVVPLVHDVALGALTLARIDGPAFTQLEIRAAREIAEATVHALLQAQAVEAARSTLDLFEDFRDVIARELRDPLTTIAGRLYLCAPKGTNEHLDAVRTAADRMRESLDRLVDAALPAAGTRARSTCESTEVVRAALAQQSHLLANLTLTTHLEPLSVRADRERLTMAFAALLAHAAAEAPASGLIVVRVEREGAFALFTVSDTGPGLVSERARHAFDGLWLGDDSGGSLTIARAIIESVGGRAWVETSPGTGAAYCFTVPIA
jgi:signal transduction histidine kinase/PAS domain-containing protein